EGNYVFRLTVTDDQNETGTDDVALVVQSAGGSEPIVNAGTDQTITLPTNSATFNGTGSDPDGGTIITYEWTQQPGGPNTATLSGNATADLTASNLVEGNYVFRLTVTDDENDTAFDEVGVTVLPEPTGGFALRINAGGPQTTYGGNVFEVDQYFDVGTSLDRSQTGLPQPYRTLRYSSSGVMGYDIPVPNGEYTVILHFAETWFGATGGGAGGVGSRVFDVSMEGQLVEDNLDVFSVAGGAQTMLVRSHTVTVTGGILDVEFSSLASVGGVRHPIINAIEVLGSGSGSSSKNGTTTALDLGSSSKTIHTLRHYPNPSSLNTEIAISDPSVIIKDIYIRDISGRLVVQYDAAEMKIGQGIYGFNVAGLEDGIYLVSLMNGSTVVMNYKLIVRK
ncbi:MAG: hypothetical protein ACI815_002820, partial [Psychroserpens sp.]